MMSIESECFENGQSGRCGIDCEVYRRGDCPSHEESRENLSGKDLDDYYAIYKPSAMLKRKAQLDVIDTSHHIWECWFRQSDKAFLLDLGEGLIEIYPERIVLSFCDTFLLDELQPVFERAREIQKVIQTENRQYNNKV